MCILPACNACNLYYRQASDFVPAICSAPPHPRTACRRVHMQSEVPNAAEHPLSTLVSDAGLHRTTGHPQTPYLHVQQGCCFPKT